jgi:hypothetical protein
VAGAAALVALVVKGAIGGTWHIALAGLGAAALGAWLAPRQPSDGAREVATDASRPSTAPRR